MAAVVAMPAGSPARDMLQGGESLDDIMATSCSTALQWRKERLQAHQADAQKALSELRRDRSAVEELKDMVASTEELAHEADDLQRASLRVQQVVRMSTEAAASRQALGDEVKNRLLFARDAQTEELEAAEGVLNKQYTDADLRREAIENFFSIYKSKLGLTIERAAPAVVQVTFDLLDEARPERTASFLLGLSDAKTYAVSECSPAVPAAFLARLVDRLNRDPNEPSALPAFCCSMRRAFKRSMCKAAGVGGA